jgi:uncharacterized protein
MDIATTDETLRAALRSAFAAGVQGGDSAHDLAHAERVWANARTIRAAEGQGSARVLMAAAYLHDLVSLPKDDPARARASTLAAAAARPVVLRLGFDEDEAGAVCHAIVAHSFSAAVTPRTPEARMLRDADRLEALGAIGIARNFAVSGALGQAFFDPEDPFAWHRPLDDARFALDHWAVKLLRLPETMCTRAGRRLAEARCADMRAFLAMLARDLGTPPPEW